MIAVWSAPVRYVECDQQGVVFNGHYLTWADEAMPALLASWGTPYQALADRGLDLTVAASELAWSSPARYGDVVAVHGNLDRIGRTSVVLAFRVQVGERLCCTVRTTYVMTDRALVPLAVPPDLRAAWQSEGPAATGG